MENRGTGEYEVLVERILEDCGDETDLFLSVRNLNRHPLPLLPPPCCWIPYAIDYVQSHTQNTEHTLVSDNKQTARNTVTNGRPNGTRNEVFVASHFNDWAIEAYIRCVCVCVCVWSGGGELKFAWASFLQLCLLYCVYWYIAVEKFSQLARTATRVSKRSSRFVDAERQSIKILDGQRISFSVPLKLRKKRPQKEVIKYLGHFIISW